MNFQLNIRPHFEFVLMAICAFIRVMTFGIVILTPKGVTAFNEKAMLRGYIFGRLAGFATFVYLVVLYIQSLNPR